MCYQPKYFVSTKLGDITDGFLTEKEAMQARELFIQDDLSVCMRNGTEVPLAQVYNVLSSLYFIRVR